MIVFVEDFLCLRDEAVSVVAAAGGAQVHRFGDAEPLQLLVGWCLPYFAGFRRFLPSPSWHFLLAVVLCYSPVCTAYKRKCTFISIIIRYTLC